MADLFDYLTWRGDLSFDKVPFNKIDALLISHISYSLLNGLVPSDFKDAKTLTPERCCRPTPDTRHRCQ